MTSTPKIRCSPNGPYALLNDMQPVPVPNLQRASGAQCATVRGVALCRCGQSKTKPFCDGTHGAIGFKDKNTADPAKNVRKSYVGKGITILDNRGICSHAGYCTDGLKAVFREDTEPWIDPDGAQVREIIATIEKCPSGALSYAIDGVEAKPKERPPMVTVTDDGPYAITGGANRFDPSIYSLDPGFSSSTEYDLDREWSGAINWTQPLSNWGSAEEYKVGVSGRLRDKVLRPTAIIFASVPNATLSPFVTNQFLTYYDSHYSIGYHFNPTAFENFYAQNYGQPNGFVVDEANTTLSNQETFQHNKEDVYAAYAQYQVTFGALGLLGGVRVENTHASYAAYPFDADKNILLALSTSDHVYTNVFPTIQARYEIAPKLIMRGSVSSAVARPGFQQISAAISLSPSTNSISQGNPGLRPTTAYNIDWSIEKVFDSGSLISLGLFDKELKNYIVRTTTRIPVSALPPTPIYSGFTSGIVSIDNYRNINQARAAGSEIAWEQRLTQLPGILRGLGVGSVFHYLPLHLSEMGRRFGGCEGDCPVTEQVSDRLLRLPLFTAMTDDEQERVLAAVRSFRVRGQAAGALRRAA